MNIVTGLSAAATLLTPVLGIAYLSGAVYSAERCFRIPTTGGSGTLSGCEYISGDLLRMLSLAPLQLAVPVGAVAIATGLAGAAWHVMSRPPEEPLHMAFFVATYSVLVVPVTLVIGPVFVVPVLCLAAAVLIASGATAQVVVREMAKGTVLVLGAFAAALVTISFWGARFGRLPYGGAEWLYVGIATALGIAAGCFAAVGTRDPRQLLRYVVLSYGGFGLGLVLAALALLPVFYPHGRYVNLGMAGVWRTASTLLGADLLAGVLVLRLFGLSWLAAVGATFAAGFGFLVALVAVGALSFRVASGDVTPPLLLLPSTSTLD